MISNEINRIFHFQYFENYNCSIFISHGNSYFIHWNVAYISFNEARRQHSSSDEYEEKPETAQADPPLTKIPK